MQNWTGKETVAIRGTARLSPRGWQSPYSTHSEFSTAPFLKLKDMASGVSGSSEEEKGKVRKRGCLLPLE